MYTCASSICIFCFSPDLPHNRYYFSLLLFSHIRKVSMFYVKTEVHLFAKKKFTGRLERSDRFDKSLKIGSSWLGALHLISLMHSFKFSFISLDRRDNSTSWEVFFRQKFAQNYNKILQWHFGINLPTLCGQSRQD